MTGSGPPSGRLRRRRRSHTLGACGTCKRRHVKCDQKRPVCRTCRRLGVACEGFSTEVRWMRSSGRSGDADQTGENGTRRHLYSESSRLSMSTALRSDLVSGSIDASLAEIDMRTRNQVPDHSTTQEDIVVGPFAVLNLAPTASQTAVTEVLEQPAQEEVDQEPGVEPALPTTPSPITPANAVPAGSISAYDPWSSMINSLTTMDDFLHWSDLLGPEPYLTGYFPQPAMDVDIPVEPGMDVDNSFLNDQSLGVSGPVQIGAEGQTDTLRMMTPPHSTAETGSTNVNIASLSDDAPVLFRNFNDKVIPQMMAMPLGEKSPWKILNVSRALSTFGDLTILGSQNVCHAQLANLYSVLACSAIHLGQKSGSPAEAINHWQQVATKTFQQARDHTQMSLKYETHGPNKSKYKDQMMALCCLTQFTIISGQHQHARGFMINAEYILRVRGLLKQSISQKSRLLHHVYTWLRVVGESTYVLHNFHPSSSLLEALQWNSQPEHSGRTTPSAARANGQNPQLDDFLRLETNHSDHDLNIDELKDRTTGLHDIHLQDSRNFSDTLYKQIYGIPETWLSLVSQTTRLANVMEAFRVTRAADGNANFEAWETLQQRSVLLENLVCSFTLNRMARMSPEHVDPSEPHGHILQALNAALVIFFYRRIRHVHPTILAGYVDNTIAALEGFNKASRQDDSASPGTAWPAFIAGCEALTVSQREAITQWLDTAESRCGFASFRMARNVMSELWSMQDEHSAAKRREPMPTWIELVKENRTWPLFG